MEPLVLRQAIRVNTTRIAEEELVEKLMARGVRLEKIPWLRYGYYADADFSLGSTKEYLLGWYYLQAPLSQLVCELLNPTDAVLDMAAAPGGKTTYLAQLVPDAVITALDTNPNRLAAVRNNVERLGLTNVICMKKDARFATDLKKTWTYVLLDAPCSGNFCSEENWSEKRTIDDIKKNARTQKELLKAAYKCLAPGGRLVYSTCSLEPEEDEDMIKWFVEKYPDLTVLSVTVPFGDTSAQGVRFWPHKTGCEGFFISVMGKT